MPSGHNPGPLARCDPDDLGGAPVWTGEAAPLPDVTELDGEPWSEARLREALEASSAEFHGGRLRRRAAVWQALRPRVPARVLQWITLGYWLPFINGVPPPPFHVPNTQSADGDPAFVDAAVEELLW